MATCGREARSRDTPLSFRKLYEFSVAANAAGNRTLMRGSFPFTASLRLLRVGGLSTHAPSQRFYLPLIGLSFSLKIKTTSPV
jgi:hypothetical protein